MLTDNRKKRMRDVVDNRQEGIVVFEDISDLHNAHAGFRTCDLFGFGKVYLIFDKEEEFNPQNTGLLSSSSARKWLDFKVFKSTEECFKELKNNGYEIIATCLDDDSSYLKETEFKKGKIAIVFGNEKKGVSDYVKKHSDKKIIINTSGMVKSFNLSVSVAIFLYEITRQRNGSFLLPDKEKEDLYQDFLQR